MTTTTKTSQASSTKWSWKLPYRLGESIVKATEGGQVVDTRTTKWSGVFAGTNLPAGVYRVDHEVIETAASPNFGQTTAKLWSASEHTEASLRLRQAEAKLRKLTTEVEDLRGKLAAMPEPKAPKADKPKTPKGSSKGKKKTSKKSSKLVDLDSLSRQELFELLMSR